VSRKPPVFRFALIGALVLVPALVPTALAGKGKPGGGGGGKPGGGGSSSISVVVVSSPHNDGLPHYGGQLTFTVSTTATSRPFVALACYQGGTMVYSMSAGFFPEYPFMTTYTLQSDYWTGGAANCTATGYYFTSNGRENVFATKTFTAEA
jgi:hypothetical protein